MASLMADREGSLPTIHRAATIDCITVKNRMETRRLIETLEALDKCQTRSLRRISSSQEKLISTQIQNEASLCTSGKRRISRSSSSFSGIETEPRGESRSHSVGSTMLPTWHVQGRNVDEEGVDATLAKSVVYLGDEDPEPMPHSNDPFFPSVKEKGKVLPRNKEGNSDQQKLKQRNASRTFLLIPEIRGHSPRGMSRQSLTPPMQSARDRLRLSSDPSPTTFPRTSPVRSPCIAGKQYPFSRSHSFNSLNSTIRDKSASCATSSYKPNGSHQRLKATRSCMCDKARHSKGSEQSGSPTLSPSFCPMCRSTADCSIFNDTGEFRKLSLADQMEVIKGSRYLRVPPVASGMTSLK